MLCCCLLFMVACASDEGTETPADTDTETPADTDTDTGTDDTVYELRMNIQDPEGLATADSAQQAIDAIFEASDGKIVITPYFNGVLGDYLTIYEDMQRGAIDLSSMSLAEQFDKRFAIMQLPYSLTSFDMAGQLWDPENGAFFQEVAAGCADTDTVLVSCVLAGFQGIGAANLGSMDTILDPNIKQEGCIIRVPMMDTYVSLGEAMGFSITTIAYGDLYSAMQTGVCDGWIGGAAAVSWINFKDIINYYVDLRYGSENCWIVASQNCVDTVGEENYAIIKQAFLDEFWDSTVEREQTDLDAIDSMIDYDIECMNPTAEELDPMATHVREVCWPYYASEIFTEYGGQEYLDMLLDAMEATK